MSSNEAESLRSAGSISWLPVPLPKRFRAFARRLTADPNYFEAHHGLIRALRDAGRLEQSIARCSRSDRPDSERPARPHCPVYFAAAGRTYSRSRSRRRASPYSGVESGAAIVSRQGRKTLTRLHSADPARRLRRLHDQLERAYGPQNWWPAETPIEVILGAYLTQNASWKATSTRSQLQLARIIAERLPIARTAHLRPICSAVPSTTSEVGQAQANAEVTSIATKFSL